MVENNRAPPDAPKRVAATTLPLSVTTLPPLLGAGYSHPQTAHRRPATTPPTNLHPHQPPPSVINLSKHFNIGTHLPGTQRNMGLEFLCLIPPGMALEVPVIWINVKRVEV
ncbi:hypothetical protein E2C01_012639 [Portunus trituberculatus]|uniref:Uncharacterized protein n=1 Tax=Portunus trituberculatus TaxID=210409 RepID=A0A5B7DEM5_PORTR|nr:hypothetical protein [Portunus trituberculatus]